MNDSDSDESGKNQESISIVLCMSGATYHADFVYFIKSASPALPNDEAFFMSNSRTRYSSLVRFTDRRSQWVNAVHIFHLPIFVWLAGSIAAQILALLGS